MTWERRCETEYSANTAKHKAKTEETKQGKGLLRDKSSHRVNSGKR